MELAILVVTSKHTTVEDKITAISQLLNVYGEGLDDISRLSNGGCNLLNPEIGFQQELRNYLAVLESKAIVALCIYLDDISVYQYNKNSDEK